MGGTNGNGQTAAGRERGILVVGGGMAGISAAIEAAEAGSDVYLVESGPSLGGRVAQLHQYFPKLCPPYCGLEINFRRIRSDHRHFKVFTLAQLERVSGVAGDYEVTIRLDPRYVIADRVIALNKCADVCLAGVAAPTCGRTVRPSDGREAKRVAFVQCAGSRDVNHLPYCSSICCLSSIKEATYVRAQYPDSEVFVFYIDIRAPGRNEDFYHRIRADEGVHFIKGKVAKVLADPSGTGDLIVEADDMLSGAKRQVPVDLVVLATGMQPSLSGAEPIPGLPVEFDEYGFALENRPAGIFVAGVAHRPADVVTSVRDATGAALKAIRATAL